MAVAAAAKNYNHLIRSLTKSLERPIELRVRGVLPNWLNGVLFRNGPGKYTFDDKTYAHFFDGHSCLNRFKIRDGKVEFFNRLLETECFKRSSRHSRLYPVFGTPDRDSTLLERIKWLFVFPETNDNVNVNVITFGDRQLYALTEVNLMCRIDPETLGILNTIDTVKRLPNSTSTMIAHPHLESDGSWINVGMNTWNKWRPSYNFIRFSNSADLLDKVELIASLPSSHRFKLSYFHSFGLSENYIVFLEQSLLFSFKQVLLAAAFNRPIARALVPAPNVPLRIHLINRHTGQIVKQKFISDPFCLFHIINCYENGGTGRDNEHRTLVVDICAYDPHSLNMNKLTYEDMFTTRLFESAAMRSTPVRIQVPLTLIDNAAATAASIYCQPRFLNRDISFDLPCINYSNHNAKPYQYVYGLNTYKSPISIVKFNLENGNEILEKNYSTTTQQIALPSEPIFVGRPNSLVEDDGVLLVQVLSETNDFLSILDAKTLQEIGRAEFPDDVKCSFTFHGYFTSTLK